MDSILDCLVIGGGPAGLTAGIYLGRFRRRVMVVDAGASRVAWIPRSHNLPGFPDGVPGDTLLKQMRIQAAQYGAELREGRVAALRRGEDGVFTAEVDNDPISARTAILATGVVENVPPLPNVADAIRRGLIRVCPICDGFEAAGKRIGVLGEGGHAVGEALFLRTYSDRVSVLLVGPPGQPLDPDRRRQAEAAGIEVISTTIERVNMDAQQATAACSEDGTERRFDTIYSAFGTVAQHHLAGELGADIDQGGCLFVDEHQQTSVEGLFAAGDVVRGLNQISVAEGEAAIAATAIHNRLPRNPA